jgi:peroxiredoxin Q/BCP
VLKIGDKAPDFHLKTDDGSELTLADFRGKRVLLFFFPKANTPG